MAKLARAVIVRDPNRHRDVAFKPGDEPDPEYAALITNPNAWEDGKLPASAKTASQSESTSSEADDSDTQQAAPKRAARKPATRRTSADEGDGGK